jgi:hypothetical protein
LKSLKHNCSLDAQGFGSCDCQEVFIERKGTIIDYESIQLNKQKSEKRNDSHTIKQRETANRFHPFGQDRDGQQDDTPLLPIGQSNFISRCKRIT